MSAPVPIMHWGVRIVQSQALGGIRVAVLITDGGLANTSPIASIEGRIVTTRSGIVYRLEGPPLWGDFQFNGPENDPMGVLAKGVQPFYLYQNPPVAWPPGSTVPPWKG